MSFVDKQLTCRDCSNTFLFTGGEQEFYASKGLQNEPVRCPPCRSARKSNRLTEPEDGYVKYGVFASFGGRTPRQMHPATCADCGMMTEVPFQPRGDRPVYCSACYNKIKGAQEAAEAAAEAGSTGATAEAGATEDAPAEEEASPELVAAEAAFPSVSDEKTEAEEEKAEGVVEATDSPAEKGDAEVLAAAEAAFPSVADEKDEAEEKKAEAIAEAAFPAVSEEASDAATEETTEETTETEEEEGTPVAEAASEEEEEPAEAVAEAADSPADEQPAEEAAEESTEESEEKAEATT